MKQYNGSVKFPQKLAYRERPMGQQNVKQDRKKTLEDTRWL